MIAMKIERKHSARELKMCTTNPSRYNSVKPLNTCPGVGKMCFSPAVPTNQTRIRKATQDKRMIVLRDLEIFSKGVKIFMGCKLKKSHSFKWLLLFELGYFNRVMTTRLFWFFP